MENKNNVINKKIRDELIYENLPESPSKRMMRESEIQPKGGPAELAEFDMLNKLGKAFYDMYEARIKGDSAKVNKLMKRIAELQHALKANEPAVRAEKNLYYKKTNDYLYDKPVDNYGRGK